MDWMLPPKFSPDGFCVAAVRGQRCSRKVAPYQTWFCDEHFATCNAKNSFYKQLDACGSKENNRNYRTMLCTYPADIQNLDIHEIEAIIVDFTKREEKVRACLNRRVAFRDVCRHRDTQDQNHATDDLRVTKIGTDCTEYIRNLQSHLTERWERAVEQQRQADARAKELREKARLAREQQAMADSQARLAREETLRRDHEASLAEEESNKLTKGLQKVQSLHHLAARGVVESDLNYPLQPAAKTKSQKKREKLKVKERQAKQDQEDFAEIQAEHLRQRTEILDKLRDPDNFKQLKGIPQSAYTALFAIIAVGLYEHLQIPVPPLGSDVFGGVFNSNVTNAQLLSLVAEMHKQTVPTVKALLGAYAAKATRS